MSREGRDRFRSTRRSFIQGVARAGASTLAAASVLEATGVTDLLADAQAVPGGRTEFSGFRAIGASSADAFEVPEGYRAQVLISWGDEFGRPDGTTFTYGFNNDYTAFLPLRGKRDEGLLFVNHEYPSPFFLHGEEDAKAKTARQIATEKYAVGNSILHLRRARDGAWEVIPSRYSRRITGTRRRSPSPARSPARRTSSSRHGEETFRVDVGRRAAGSVANCSGGTTPWNTVLSCEENFQDYGEDEYGWGDPYEISRSARYGWVVEHDPYDPGSTPRKHTALGRFRHENAALRHVRGKKLVVYMGDDAKNEGVYKFVSDRRAVFMLPARGPNRGVAFRFANMPVEAEGTGPYFSPDGSTLFINVQHPGEETPSREGARYGDPATYSSWWPGGNRTAQTGRRGKPKPSTVAVTRVRD